jgi:hypothetical protein
MGGPLHPVARWDQDYTTHARLAGNLIDDEHDHRTRCTTGIPATVLTTTVALMALQDLIPYAIAVTQLLATAETDSAPLCGDCGAPSWPDMPAAVCAAYRHARRYGTARSVRRCPAGAGWHHTRRDPLEVRA